MAQLKTVDHKIQLSPAQHNFLYGTARYRGFVGGRGAGKSWVGAYDLIKRARTTPNRLYMVAAPTYPMLQDATLRTFLAIARGLGLLRPGDYRKTPPSVTLPNGTEILFRSADDPDRLRGPNLSGVWLDEASYMDEEAFNVSIACLRESGSAGWLSATFTPKGIGHWTYQRFGKERPDTSITKAHTNTNPFLSPEFVKSLEQQYSDRQKRQEMGGEFVDQEGAEWPAAHFEDHIWFSEWPETLEMKVIGVDPSKGASSKHGDYSAIVKLGKGKQGIIYVEADLKRRPSEEIVDQVIETQRVFHADAIAMETNQFQELLAVDVQRKARLSGMALPVVPVVNTVNKLVRIRRLGPYLSQHNFRFKADHPGTQLLVGQLRDFPVGEHDDGPDAFETGLRTMIDLWNGKAARTQTLKGLRAR